MGLACSISPLVQYYPTLKSGHRLPLPFAQETESGRGIMEEPDLTLVSLSDVSSTEVDFSSLTLEKENEASPQNEQFPNARSSFLLSLGLRGRGLGVHHSGLTATFRWGWGSGLVLEELLSCPHRPVHMLGNTARQSLQVRPLKQLQGGTQQLMGAAAASPPGSPTETSPQLTALPRSTPEAPAGRKQRQRESQRGTQSCENSNGLEKPGGLFRFTGEVLRAHF